MSYEIHLRMKWEDVGQEFKPKWLEFNKDIMASQKHFIEAICMMPFEYTSLKMNSVHKELSYAINMYKSLLEENWKNMLKKDFDDIESGKEDTYWQCGWEYSNNCIEEYIENYENVCERTLEDLFLLTVTSNSYDIVTDNEKFHEKLAMVKDSLDYFKSIVYEYWNHKFIDIYRDKYNVDNE